MTAGEETELDKTMIDGLADPLVHIIRNAIDKKLLPIDLYLCAKDSSVSDVLAALAEASVPAGRVYTAKDIVEDPHYRARDMILKQQTRDGHEIEVPGIVPKLMGTPGQVRSAAPKLGDDTDAVLAELGLDAQAIAQLRERKVVA